MHALPPRIPEFYGDAAPGHTSCVAAKQTVALSCDTDSAQFRFRPRRPQLSDSAEEHGCCMWSRKEEFSGGVSDSSLLVYRVILG